MLEQANTVAVAENGFRPPAASAGKGGGIQRATVFLLGAAAGALAGTLAGVLVSRIFAPPSETATPGRRRRSPKSPRFDLLSQ